MTFNEIEKKAYNFKGTKVWIFDENKINENIIKVLQICIKNNIKLDLVDDDIIKIISIYYDLYGKVNNYELKKIIRLVNKKIDYVKLLNKMGI